MKKQAALVQLHLGALLLGGSALLPRFVHLPTDQLVLLRSTIAAALLFALAAISREQLLPRSRRDALWILTCSLLLGLHWLTYFETIRISTVALASVCFYTFPVITVFLEPLFGRTRLHTGDIIAALIVLAGVALIARPGTGVSAEALTLGLACAVLMALRNVLYRHHLQDYPPIGTTGWQFLIVSLALMPTLSPSALADYQSWWPAMLVFGVLFTAAPHVLFVSSMRALPAKSLGLVTSLMPLYATLFAWLLFHEFAGWNVMAGGVLIIGAAFYESFKT